MSSSTGDVMSRPGPDAASDEDDAGNPVRSLLDQAYRDQAEYFGRVAFLLTGSSEQAEDLVQEAFARVIARVHEVKDPRALRGYLRTSVTNLAINGYRKRDHERAYLRRWGHTHQRQASVPPDVETRHDLMDVLRSLPMRQRAVIVLRYYEDLPEKEIAALLRCPVGSVKSSLSRALDTLRINISGGDSDE
jgi:RNA polymerase sigma-70 factor (sigma-E family)